MSDAWDESGSGQGAPVWAPGYGHLTGDIAPIPFRFRAVPEDFVVREVPEELEDEGEAAQGVQEEPGVGDVHREKSAGGGTHWYFDLEKRGLGTVEAVQRIARALGRRDFEIGYAGRKDAFAVTSQRISIEHVDPAQVEALELNGITLRRVAAFGRKLRLGALRGNRFELRLLELDPRRRADFESVLDVLSREGLPNYFGEQRFGRRGLSFRLGRCLIAGDPHAYLCELLSPDHIGPNPAVEELASALHGATRSAQRRLTRLTPKLPPDLAAVAKQLARRPNDWAAALRAVPKRTRRFHLSAFQSRVFNRVLSARLSTATGPRFAELWPGDVAFEHESRRSFPIPAEEPVPEELVARCGALELSPSGPLPGSSLPRAAAEAGILEAQALAAEGLSHEDLAGFEPGFRAGGARRPLRVPVTELESVWRPPDEEGFPAGKAEVRLRFRLPSGSFATSLLEELRKRFAGESRAIGPIPGGGDGIGAAPDPA